MINQLLGPQGGQPMANPMMPDAPQPSYTPQELDNGIYHNKQISSMLSGLITDPNTSTKDVLRALSDAVKGGSLSAQQAAKEAADMPNDPKELKMFLKNHFIQNLETGRKLHALKHGV